MRSLAAVGTGDRLYVLRPAPAGLEGGHPDDAVADVEDVHVPFVGHRAHLVRRVGALLLEFHVPPQSDWPYSHEPTSASPAVKGSRAPAPRAALRAEAGCRP